MLKFLKNFYPQFNVLKNHQDNSKLFLIIIFQLSIYNFLSGCSATNSSSKTDSNRKAITKDQFNVWQYADKNSVDTTTENSNLPLRYQILKLNINKAKQKLAQLDPSKRKIEEIRFVSGKLDMVLLDFPWPDGHFYTYEVKNSTVMSPELAEKFPDIRSYKGQKQKDPTVQLRLDINPKGLFAMITTTTTTIFIRPFGQGESRYYICYDKADVDKNNKKFFEPPLKKKTGNYP